MMSLTLKSFRLFRVLFPQWNFFDQIAFDFSLEVRPHSSSNWSAISLAKPLKIWNLFFNVDLSLNLLKRGLLEQFNEQLQETNPTSPELLSSYHYVKEWALFEFEHLFPYEKSFQFRILATNESDQREVFRSEVISRVLP